MPRRDGAAQSWTKPRSMRIPDDVWEAARLEAANRGETVTDAVVKFLRRYGRSSSRES